MADYFEKTIIKHNEKKVHYSSKPKLDIFLHKTVDFKIIPFWKTKNVFVHKIFITFYDKCYLVSKNIPNMQFCNALIIENMVFLQYQGQGYKINKFQDFFTIKFTIIKGNNLMNRDKNRK